VSRLSRHRLNALAALLASALLLLTSAPATPQRGVEEQAALYQKFLDNFKGGVEQQKVAHEAALEYLRKYSDEDEVGRYLKRWSEKYAEALVAWNKDKAKGNLYERISASRSTDPKLAYELTKEFLQKYPDDAYAPSLREWLRAYESGAAPKTNGVGKAESVEPASSQAVSPGRFYALVIGNSNYRHASSLITAAEDARAVEAVLRERYGFETTVLLDADRQQLVSALDSFGRDADEDASLLIYYAGHGHYDSEADKAYWLPVDARPGNKAGWVGADYVTARAKALPAKHVLIVSDSRYSGTIYRAAGAAASTATGHDKFIETVYGRKSRTLMASGGNEPVEDVGGIHSVFASAFLRGLSEMQPEVFTGMELFRDYVLESVAGKANQTPEYSALKNSGHDGGEFVFVRKKQ
jgi:hypothetical protein